MATGEKSWFFVLVTDGAEVAADDLKVSVLSDVVFRHFEHSQMKVCDWAEGTTCYEDDGSFGGILKNTTETIVRERIVRRVGERFCQVNVGCSHGWEEEKGGI